MDKWFVTNEAEKMAEENQASEENNEAGPKVEALQAQLAEMGKSIEGLTAKNQELLTETKAAKTKKREAEAEAQRVANEKAEKDGNHEQLYKSSQDANNALQAQLDEMKGGISKEKRDNAAMKIATTLADGDNAELLSGFIAQRLKYTDEGVKVTDANGDLTVSSVDDLATEFKNNGKFASLLKGNQSSGGGASGGSNGSGAANTKTRAEFEALNQNERAVFSKTKGSKVTD